MLFWSILLRFFGVKKHDFCHVLRGLTYWFIGDYYNKKADILVLIFYICTVVFLRINYSFFLRDSAINKLNYLVP